MRYSWKTLFRWLALLVASLLLVSILGSALLRVLYRADYERFDAVKVGMTEAEVRTLLGEPSREYRAETAPEDYYVKGYGYKKRAISGSVLIYPGVEPIAYVYFDKSGRVEEVYIGGS